MQSIKDFLKNLKNLEGFTNLGDFWGFLKILASKLAGIPAFLILAIIVIAIFGEKVPSVFQALIYILCIGGLIVYILQVRIEETTKRIQAVAQKPLPSPAKEEEKTESLPEPQKPELPASKNPEPAPDYKTALDCYLRAIIQDCSTIRLSGLDPNASDPNRRRMSLEKLYVSLDTTTPRNWQKESEAFEKDEGPLSALEVWINSRDRRMVLLGLPGTGKSTFVRYLALSMAKAFTPGAELPQGWTSAPLTPFMVSLGRFAETLHGDCKKGRAELIETYLVDTMKSSEGACDFAAHALRTLEKDGGLVMFDGLDEVAELSQRPLVVQAVEDFVEKYGKNPASHFLVTCRTYSYQHDAAWKLTGWETHELALLDEDKIDYFVHAWYEELSNIEPARKNEFTRKQDDLLKALQPGDRRHLLDIAAFPIILTIMAVVHTHKGSLPDTRAKVYENCVDLLLVKWEAERPVEGKLQKQNILDALQVSDTVLYQALWEVAYKAHSTRDGDESALVTEDLLSGVLWVYLNDGEKVDTFLDYCQTANGLLMLQGTVAQSGRPPRKVYAFPHLTFEEYLAARHLADRTPEEYVYSRVGQSDRWRETVKLLGEHLCFGSPQRANMDALLTELSEPPASATDEERLRLTWLAGDLLVLYRRAFPSRKATANDRIFNQLEKAAVNDKADPRIRANCADLADELGHKVPDLHAFVLIPNAEKPTFMIGRYPVTNAQYARFLKKENFSNPQLWINVPKFSKPNEMTGQVKWLGDWGNTGWDWLQQQEKKDGIYCPPYWHHNRFGISRPHAPVVTVTWWEANAYCRWLLAHWDELPEGQQGLPKPVEIRLPTEPEWVTAAGGENNGRFSWGKLENEKEIIRYANIRASSIDRTTPVWIYPQGESQPHHLMDLSGNIWEWQANNYSQDYIRCLRSGSWSTHMEGARVAYRNDHGPDLRHDNVGFRVVGLLLPPS